MKPRGGLWIFALAAAWAMPVLADDARELKTANAMPRNSANAMPLKPPDPRATIGRDEPRLSVRDFSRIYFEEPPPREIKVHDIITILVSEKSEVTVDSQFNRQRNAQLLAELKEFIRFDDSGNLTNAAADEPSVDAQLRSRLNSFGQLRDKEGITYQIAATVVDVHPNGNVVLEARKSIRTNRDVWEYRLTGEISPQNVTSKLTAESKDIANLIIEKDQHGKVYDSTKRPWGIKLYDLFSPF